jgi:putative endonuclease
LVRHLKQSSHILKGKNGENLALEYLVKSGFEILETNWSANKAEIDIIYKEGDELVFVEVKTRETELSPEKSVTYRKQKLIASAASQYMESIQYEWKIRFDIIAIVHHTNENFTIMHYKDAFFPGWDFK